MYIQQLDCEEKDSYPSSWYTAHNPDIARSLYGTHARPHFRRTPAESEERPLSTPPSFKPQKKKRLKPATITPSCFKNETIASPDALAGADRALSRLRLLSSRCPSSDNSRVRHVSASAGKTSQLQPIGRRVGLELNLARVASS
ncbi:hypothetical protein Bbelb_336380 [Branchiostoma belcheri]|nr:hypothetical protein Bbelb_336380 [Branchiostoma belcheri]